MSSRPVRGLLAWGWRPVGHTVDLERGRVLLAPACDEAEQPGQAEGVVAVRVRHEDLVHERGAHHAALQLDLRPLARVEEPEGVFHLCGKRGGSGLASWLSGRPLSAPDHAPGYPELRPASAYQPLGPRWPPVSALFFYKAAHAQREGRGAAEGRWVARATAKDRHLDVDSAAAVLAHLGRRLDARRGGRRLRRRRDTGCGPPLWLRRRRCCSIR